MVIFLKWFEPFHFFNYAGEYVFKTAERVLNLFDDLNDPTGKVVGYKKRTMFVSRIYTICYD